MKKLHDDTVVSRTQGVVYKQIEEKMYILDYQTASLRTLNETASFVWKQLSRPKTTKRLLTAILKEFAVDEETAKKDLEKFIASYERAGLIQLK